MAALQGQLSLLENLPTEIVIEIMKHSPNFSCLWSLVKASSRFSSIFITFAWAIVEEVMTKTTSVCIQAFMKMLLKIRTSPEVFIGAVDVLEYAIGKKQFESFSHQRMEPQVLRDFVELAHNIHAVAYACLEFYLEKLKDLKPQRMHDSDLENHDRMLSVLYSEHPLQGQPFQPNLDFGPPTYLEEQRVVRILWKFQAFMSLRVADGTHALAHWSEKDHHVLRRPIVGPLIRRIHEKQQFAAVLRFSNEITGGPSEDAYANIEKKRAREDALARFLQRPPVSIYNRGYHLPCFPKPGLIPRWGRLVEIDTMIKEEPEGSGFYTTMVVFSPERSPLYFGTFNPWDKFGFEFWDDDRVVELGLLPPKHLRDRLNSRPEPWWFIWRSILTPEEDAERRSDVAKQYISSLNRENKE